MWVSVVTCGRAVLVSGVGPQPTRLSLSVAGRRVDVDGDHVGQCDVALFRRPNFCGFDTVTCQRETTVFGVAGVPPRLSLPAAGRDDDDDVGDDDDVDDD